MAAAAADRVLSHKAAEAALVPCLYLLRPLFSGLSSADAEDAFIAQVRRLFAYRFPASSRAVREDSLLLSEYELALLAIFSSFLATLHPKLLAMVLPLFHEGDEHFYWTQLMETLQTAANSSLTFGADRAARLFDSGVQILGNGAHPAALRFAAARTLLASQLNACSVRAPDLVRAHLRRLMDYSLNPASLLATGTSLCGLLAQRAGAFVVLEAVVATVDADILRGDLNVACATEPSPQPTALLLGMIKSCLALRKESLRTEPDTPAVREYSLLLHQHAFRCLVVIILRTQSAQQLERLYEAWIFKDDAQVSADSMWNKLVDALAPLQLHGPNLPVHRWLWPRAGAPSSPESPAPAEAMPEADGEQPSAASANDAGMEVEGEEWRYVSAAADSLESNPVYYLLVSVLRHWSSSGAEASYSGNGCPKWMVLMLETMSSPLSTQNTRFMLAKLILAEPAPFQRYAPSVLAGLVQLVADGAVALPGFHRFYWDLCYVVVQNLAASLDITQPSVRSSVQQFVAALVDKLGTSRREDVRVSLAVLGKVLEVWGASTTVSAGALEGLLNSEMSERSIAAAALGLVKLLYERRVRVVDGNNVSFVRAIAKHLAASTHHVYVLACDACCAVLDGTEELGVRDVYRSMVQALVEVVTTLFDRENPGAAVGILCRVSARHGQHFAQFDGRALESLQQLHGEGREQCLVYLGHVAGHGAAELPRRLSAQASMLLGLSKDGSQAALLDLYRRAVEACQTAGPTKETVSVLVRDVGGSLSPLLNSPSRAARRALFKLVAELYRVVQEEDVRSTLLAWVRELLAAGDGPQGDEIALFFEQSGLLP
ncbi:MAG TPA: hypothetical protein VJB16_05775, partial [archaeon]|nr:hypothetical protein [archaeon]